MFEERGEKADAREAARIMRRFWEGVNVRLDFEGGDGRCNKAAVSVG
jgi:hypothetical protein